MSNSHEPTRERHWLCARRLSERRHELGLTQYDVVERLDALGVSASNRMLSAMEHGQGVDVGRLPELAAALDCSVTYLLGLTEDPRRWQPDDGRMPADLISPTPTASAPAPAGSPVPPRPWTGWILGPEIPEPLRAPDSRHA
jgi:transcriptional regulator with XRE-family HTH domain